MLPKRNELPLDVQASENVAEGGESTVWRVQARTPEAEDRLIALKQVRKESFASDEEMKKSKDFYDFLKSFPDFGTFVPDTLYFKARMTPDDPAGAYMLQHFVEGRSIDTMADDELYRDPVVVEQLLAFTKAAAHVIEATREDRRHRPDFGTAFSASLYAIMVDNYLSNPRYTTNIVITNEPDKSGQRVFFVDTGINIDERRSKATEVARREVGGRLQVLQLNRCEHRLQHILDARTKQLSGSHS